MRLAKRGTDVRLDVDLKEGQMNLRARDKTDNRCGFLSVNFTWMICLISCIPVNCLI